MKSLFIITLFLYSAPALVWIWIRVAPSIRVMRSGRPTIHRMRGLSFMFGRVAYQIMMATFLVVSAIRAPRSMEGLDGALVWYMGLFTLCFILFVAVSIHLVSTIRHCPAAYMIIGLRRRPLKAMLDEVLRELEITFIEIGGSYHVSGPVIWISNGPVVDQSVVGKRTVSMRHSIVAFQVRRTGWWKTSMLVTVGSSSITADVADAMAKRLAEFPSRVRGPDLSDGVLNQG